MLNYIARTEADHTINAYKETIPPKTTWKRMARYETCGINNSYLIRFPSIDFAIH